LPIKGCLSHPQLGFRRGKTRSRGINISLLLDRIEARQNVAAFDVSPDVYEPLKHATTDAKRQVGSETGLHLAGERYGSLSVPRLDNLGTHKCRTLGQWRAVIIAGAQWRRQQSDREAGIQTPLNWATNDLSRKKACGKTAFHDTSMGWRAPRDFLSSAATAVAR
jgi:hypothetical protein